MHLSDIAFIIIKLYIILRENLLRHTQNIYKESYKYLLEDKNGRHVKLENITCFDYDMPK